MRIRESLLFLLLAFLPTMMSAQKPGEYIKRPKTQQNTGGQKKEQKPKTAAMSAETRPCIVDSIDAQIKQVVKDLDELKMIKGKDRKGASKIKKGFVEGTIKPKVNQLGNQVAVPKKKDIKQIINMLNDNRTIQSSEKGLPTAEGNAQIENIKKIVKQLQD